MKQQSLITILLTVFMSMMGAKVSAHDIEAVNSDGVTIYYVWTNNNTELAVSYQGTSSYQSQKYSGTVNIPEKVEYDGNTYNVTAIGDYAFLGCSDLTSMSIPNSVTSIRNSAFSGCSGLTSVSIPSSVSNIGWYAFQNCNSLTAVHISDLDAWCKIEFAYHYNSNPLSVAHHLFLNGEEIKELSIPSSVTSIGKYAFQGCSGITSVTIPNSVSSIGSYAFMGCSGLKSVTIPNSIKSIDYNTFEGCSSLTSITIPTSVTSIDYSAFSGCKGLTSIGVESGNNVYDSRDNCNAIIAKNTNTLILGCKNTIIPSSVTSIGRQAFDGCSGLASITIPSSVTSIGYNAFLRCSGLTAVHISDLDAWCRIKFAGESSNPLSCTHHLFLNGEEIKELSIPSSVTSIGDYAFYGCSGLTSVIIPNSVTKIGILAFGGCDNLQSFIIPEHFKRTIHVATAGTLSELISPDEKYQIMELTLTGELNGTDIHLIRDMAGVDMDRMEESEFCVLCNETVFTKGILRALDMSGANIVEGGRDYYKMLWSSSSRKYGDKQYTTANTISESMFVYCRPLAELILPRSVTSISPLLFSDNYGGGSFTNIEVLNIAEGNSYYESPNDCNAIIEKNTKTLIVGCRTTKIPDDVTSIGNDAFFSIAGLTSITIPSSVTSIGGNAFNGCGLLFLTAEPTTPPSIAESAFPNRANIVLQVPTGSVEAYAKADFWKDFKEIKDFAKVEEVDCSVEDDNTATVSTANDPTEKDVVIPERVIIDGELYPVTAIGENAFKDNTELVLVCIPETIEEIGDNAFAGCNGLTAIYSYSEEPIALGSGKATVRTRADGDETSASTVFAEVDKNNCILYVPLNSADKYRAAVGWGEFQNIVEMKSNKPGDANNDGEVDGKDLDATSAYILEGKTVNFIFLNADVKTDNKINAADIVKIVNLKN